MKKQVELFIHAAVRSWSKDAVISVQDFDMSRMDGYHLIGKQTVELDIPDFDIVQIQVDGIEQQIVKLRAEFQSSLKQLEDRKAELLAIGHDVEAE